MAKSDDSASINMALVLGYIATKDLATTEKKVAVLTLLGFSNPDMAKICGTNDKVIRTIKSKVKRSK